MSDVKLIASHINTLLQAGSFAGKPFQQGKFYGVAELVKKTNEEPDDEVTVPIVMDDDGDDGVEVVINDAWPFQLYHRVKSVKVEEIEKEDNFGDGLEKMLIFEMSLIVFSDRFKNELDANAIITALAVDMPRTLKATNITGAQFLKCSITYNDFVIDAADVLAQEYGGKNFAIKQNYVAVSFGYTLVLIYNKGCYNLC